MKYPLQGAPVSLPVKGKLLGYKTSGTAASLFIFKSNKPANRLPFNGVNGEMAGTRLLFDQPSLL